MKSYPVSVQLYSLRDASAKDFIDVLKRVASFGFSGVEFAGLNNHPVKEIKKVIDDLGLKASGMHGNYPKNDTVNQIIETAQALDCKNYVHPWWSADDLKTEQMCIDSGKKLHESSQLFINHGIKLGFHNHNQEIENAFNGKYALEIIFENAPEVIAEIDTYWATVGGANTPELIKKLKHKTPLLHIKDGSGVKGEKNAIVGQGIMKWDAVIGAADPQVLQWLVVEFDHCEGDIFEAVKKSHEFLIKSGLGK